MRSSLPCINVGVQIELTKIPVQKMVDYKQKYLVALAISVQHIEN